MSARFVAGGTLKHKIEILAPATTKDAHGQPSQAWQTLGFRRAGVTQKGGGDTGKAGAENSVSSYEIMVRYDSLTNKITSSNRIKKGALVYEVVGYPDSVDCLNRYIVIQAKMVNP